jgi:hypothetical protein
VKNHSESLSKQFEEYATTKLIELLDSNAGFYRAHALAALAKRTSQDETLISTIIENIRDPKNVETRIIGTISVSHIGIANLLQANSSKAREAAKDFVNSWPEPDRNDLFKFLRSESITFS